MSREVENDAKRRKIIQEVDDNYVSASKTEQLLPDPKISPKIVSSSCSEEGVRHQIAMELGFIALRTSGDFLPRDTVMKIIDYTLITDFHHLTDDNFEEDNFVILSSSTPNDDEMPRDDDDDAWASLILPNELRRKQMQTIFDLESNNVQIKTNSRGRSRGRQDDDEEDEKSGDEDEDGDGMLTPWGNSIEEVLENGDIAVTWARVGFYVGWPKSTQLLEFDMWLFAEFHHWHAPFVFSGGTNWLRLRYDPIHIYTNMKQSSSGSGHQNNEHNEKVSDDHAKKLSKMVEGVMFSVMCPE